MTYKELNIEERATIQVGLLNNLSLRRIARLMGRSPGSLRDALYYPATPDVDDSRLCKAILQCGLEHLLPKLDEILDWSQTLSIGEQQRCAFIRALLNKPTLLLLDESTSALDERSEHKLYKLLLDEMPDSIIVSIAHRKSLSRFHSRTLTLKPEYFSDKSEGGCRL